MLISVIIPTFNEAANITKAIESALEIGTITPVEVEVIVVDGGSCDETVKLAQEAGALAIDSDIGRGIQLAEGISQSKGEWIVMLHADSVLGADVGSQLLRVSQKVNIVHGAMNQRIDREGFKYRLLEWGNRKRVEWFSLPYGDQAIFIKREAYEEIGGMPKIPIMEDVELMTRLRRIAKPVLLEGPVYLSARRWEQNGIIRQTLKNWSLLLAYRFGVSAEKIARWYR